METATPKRRGSSRYVGVSHPRTKKTWTVSVTARSDSFQIAGFVTEREAAIARDRIVLGLKLPYALNLPEASKKAGPATVEQVKREVRARGKLRNHTSRFFGVHWNSKTECWWTVAVVPGNKPSYVAHFDREEDAAVAYDRVMRRLVPGHVLVNFPGRPPRSRRFVGGLEFCSSRRPRAGTSVCTMRRW